MQCMGPSMLPTFNTRGDVLLLEHLSTHFGRISVGELEHLSLLTCVCCQIPYLKCQRRGLL